MTKVNFSKVFIAIVAVMSVSVMSCGNGGSSNKSPSVTTEKKQLKFDINEESETFSIVDTKSGSHLSYKKIIIDGKEIVGTTYFMGIVIFYFENNENVGFQGDSKKDYQLEDGVLTILKE